MNKLLKDLYDCFYTLSGVSVQKQEIEEWHQALIEVLEKPERWLVLDHRRQGLHRGRHVHR